MPKNPETKFKNRIFPQLEAIPNSWWFVVQLVSLRGIPDIIGVINGRFVALELKVNYNKPTKLQMFVLDKIKRAGGYAEVVYPETWEEIKQELTTLSLALN